MRLKQEKKRTRRKILRTLMESKSVEFIMHHGIGDELFESFFFSQLVWFQLNNAAAE
jgi:hypothetical protein